MIAKFAKRLFRVPAQVGVVFVMGFQAMVRPFLAGTCRYTPSCSHYAIESLHVHGLVAGTRLAVGRLLRCRPFAPGGFDPVPPATTDRD